MAEGIEWLRAENQRHLTTIEQQDALIAQLKQQLEKDKIVLEKDVDTIRKFRAFMHLIVYQADQVLETRKKAVMSRMDYDKKQYDNATVKLAVTVDKAKRKGYGTEIPETEIKTEQGKLL